MYQPLHRLKSQATDTRHMLPPRFLTYRNSSGLCNRIRLHMVAAEYADVHGLRLLTQWERNDDCHATFADLFYAPAVSEYSNLSFFNRLGCRLSRHLMTTGQLSHVCPVNELPPPTKFLTFLHPDFPTNPATRMARPTRQKHVKRLQPTAMVTQQIQDLKIDKSQRTVGIHFRAGDFVQKYKDRWVSPAHFVPVIQHVKATLGNVHTFLVSDSDPSDPAMRPLLDSVDTFIETRCRRRDAVDGIAEALAQLILLSQSELIIGTPFSSYNVMASIWGEVPLLVVANDWRDAFQEYQNRVNEDASNDVPNKPLMLNCPVVIAEQFA